MKLLNVLTLLVLPFAGCSSLKRADTTRFYTLSPVAIPESGAARSSFNGLLFVSPVEVASHLENPGIVLRMGTNRVEFAEQHHWAQPLRDNVTEVIRANLENLLGAAQVHPLGRQRPRGPFIALQARFDLFELQERKEAVLSATWRLSDGDSGKPLLVRATRIEKPLADGPIDFGSHIAVLGETLDELSRQIAGALPELLLLDR